MPLSHVLVLLALNLVLVDLASSFFLEIEQSKKSMIKPSDMFKNSKRKYVDVDNKNFATEKIAPINQKRSSREEQEDLDALIKHRDSKRNYAATKIENAGRSEHQRLNSGYENVHIEGSSDKTTEAKESRKVPVDEWIDEDNKARRLFKPKTSDDQSSASRSYEAPSDVIQRSGVDGSEKISDRYTPWVDETSRASKMATGVGDTLLATEHHSPGNSQHRHHGEDLESEPTPCEKGQCSPNRFHILTGLVSIIWLLNIGFITWMCLLREQEAGLKKASYSNKSPQRNVHQKSAPLAADAARGTRSTSAARTLLLLQRSPTKSTPATLKSIPVSARSTPHVVRSVDNARRASPLKVAWPSHAHKAPGYISYTGSTNYKMPSGDHRMPTCSRSEARRLWLENPQYNLSPKYENRKDDGDNAAREHPKDASLKVRKEVTISDDKLKDVQNMNSQNLAAEPSTLNRQGFLEGSNIQVYKKDRLAHSSSTNKLEESLWEARVSSGKDDRLYLGLQHQDMLGRSSRENTTLRAGSSKHSLKNLREDKLTNVIGSLGKENEKFLEQDAFTQMSIICEDQNVSGPGPAHTTITTQCPSLCLMGKARKLQVSKEEDSPTPDLDKPPMKKKKKRGEVAGVAVHDRFVGEPKYEPEPALSCLDHREAVRPTRRGQKKKCSPSFHASQLPDLRDFNDLVVDGDLMASPPLGYHVRKDFSNPDSTSEVIRKVKIDNVGEDMSIATLVTPENSAQSLMPGMSAAAYEGYESNESCSFLQQERASRKKTKHSHLRECLYDITGKDQLKRSKKLVLLKKLNHLNSEHNNKEIQPPKALYSATRKIKKSHGKKERDCQEDWKHKGSHFRLVYPVVIKTSDNIKSGVTEPNSKRRGSRSPKRYYKIMSPVGNSHSVRMNQRRHDLKPPLLGRGYTRVVIRRGTENVNKRCSGLTASRSEECQPFLKTETMARQHSSRYHKVPFQLARTNLQPPFFANLNSNAGVPKQSTRMSMPTNSTAKLIDNDMKVSSAFSFTQGEA